MLKIMTLTNFTPLGYLRGRIPALATAVAVGSVVKGIWDSIWD